ncbi:transporter [Balneolaceae bacterium YR4-1]|uniref:Transporter n=1 Tax=Halalkalibaculum roseum TaxID=2709311 RepID=A0A6M1T062_9BACT|nr:OmpP1/FadL family transporter [Halalkalibaculum roseum]NGP78068.1 transporter [Halalkalibaculum roseum]
MRRFIATICFIFIGTYSALASGFSIYEASVRANGMLGAFSAYADHVTTIYYNPAGLSGLDGIQISAGATIIAPRTSFRNLSPLASAGEKFDMQKQEFLVPNFFGSYQVADGFTVGVGVYAPFGLGTEWDQNWVGRGESIEANIQTLFANPAIGYELPDFGIGDIKIGAGLQVAFFGEVSLRRAIRQFTPEASFSLDGELKEPAFGFNAGILYSPIEELTLGFTYRSEVKTEYEGNGNFRNLPGRIQVPVEGSAEIDLPASWVAAVNVKPMEGLTVEADYVWWGWSSYDELRIEFKEPVPVLGITETVSERNYEDSWQIRLGAEYTELPLEFLTVRAGIAYDKNPIKDEYVDPTLPDSDRWLFSGGVTFTVTNYMDIDASYIFIRGKERRVEGTESGIDGVYNTHANLPGLGATLKF